MIAEQLRKFDAAFDGELAVVPTPEQESALRELRDAIDRDGVPGNAMAYLKEENRRLVFGAFIGMALIGEEG